MATGGGGGLTCKCLVRSSNCNDKDFNFNFNGLHKSRIIIKSSNRRNLRNVSMASSFRKGFYVSGSVSPNRAVFSMAHQEKSRSTTLESSQQKKVPLFVMMPADTIVVDTAGIPRIRRVKAIAMSLKALQLAGVHGITVEVWWGIVERSSPSEYDWHLYEELFKLISESGLKLHVALSFHSSMQLTSKGIGGVSLPLWILEIGRQNRNIYYRDQNGFSNDEYLTLGVDQIPLFCGRTALQCYEDFMLSFMNKFEHLMGSVIEEISIGLGPSGELRYPAHPFNDKRWRYPGIGEFQCYDKYMMENLEMSACIMGKPDWGCKGPQNAGCYNSIPYGIPFFGHEGESFSSDYGRFFLEWYSGKLLQHADLILGKAASMLKKYQDNGPDSVLLVAKIAVIYWWYRSESHPAELTAGYYNTALRDGYDPLARILSRHGAALHISCLEMIDRETPSNHSCSPEGLLRQIWTVSKNRALQLTGRNAAERFDKPGFLHILENCYSPHSEAIRSFTYFRMNENVFKPKNFCNFVPFVKKMNREYVKDWDI